MQTESRGYCVSSMSIHRVSEQSSGSASLINVESCLFSGELNVPSCSLRPHSTASSKSKSVMEILQYQHTERRRRLTDSQ